MKEQFLFQFQGDEEEVITLVKTEDGLLEITVSDDPVYLNKDYAVRLAKVILRSFK